MAARFAHERNAVAFGLISIAMRDGPDHPIVWMVDDTHLSLARPEGDPPMSDELQNLVELCLRLFFTQIVPIAPTWRRCSGDSRSMTMWRRIEPLQEGSAADY